MANGGGIANLRPVRAGQSSPALRHGAYSRIRLAPRAAELAGELGDLVPFGTESDEPAIDVLALALAQVELAGMALQVARADQVRALNSGAKVSRAERDALMRLSADCRGWVETATRL